MKKNDDVSIANIQSDVKYIRRDVDVIREKMEGSYVTKEEFEPVKNVVYGLVGLILIAVVGALVALVISK